MSGLTEVAVSVEVWVTEGKGRKERERMKEGRERYNVCTVMTWCPVIE